MNKDPFAPPVQERHIPDYDFGDLPLDVVETQDDFFETEQTEQLSVPLENWGEDMWIAEALAKVKVFDVVSLVANGSERKEQMRTENAKKRFLEAYSQNMCSITKSCAAADVGRTQYYEWMKVDHQFRLAVYNLEEQLCDIAEDKLKGLMDKEDASSLRYFLDRRSPKYKPKSEHEHVIAGVKTFEDLLYEAAAKRKAAKATVIEVKNEEPKQIEDANSGNKS